MAEVSLLVKVKVPPVTLPLSSVVRAIDFTPTPCSPFAPGSPLAPGLPCSPFAPAAPGSPFGIVKLNTAALVVPLFVTIGFVPGSPATTVPTVTVAASPGAPGAPSVPFLPGSPAGPT